MLKMEHREGRSELAPELHSLIKKGKCQRYNSTSNVITKRPNNRHNETDNKMCSNECQCNGIYMFCEKYENRNKQSFYKTAINPANETK